MLGIDAAWTTRHPSGVALVGEGPSGWKLLSCASSYDEFLGPPVRSEKEVYDPDPSLLIGACVRQSGSPPELVAIDMPLSMAPITGRRVADDLVSRAYGARHCGTHTPSAARPGVIADALRSGFAALGYPLATQSGTSRGLVEVYPHPALVELIGAPRRLEYKVGKMRRYWPRQTAAERRTNLLSVWSTIIETLNGQVAGVRQILSEPDPEGSLAYFKAFEDRLDAVVCAWIGICVLNGTAEPFGDDASAIWIPSGCLPRRQGPSLDA